MTSEGAGGGDRAPSWGRGEEWCSCLESLSVPQTTKQHPTLSFLLKEIETDIHMNTCALRFIAAGLGIAKMWS